MDVTTKNLDDDDLLNGLGEEHELHIDFAHSISLGYNKERYYLLFAVGGVNFMWETPTKTRASPEDLLWEFLAATRLKIRKLQVDWEFDASSSFKAFCAK